MTYYLTSEVDAVVAGVARQVARKYRLELADLWQQGRLWVLAHPRRMAVWLEEDDKQAWEEIADAVRAELERTARREKAQRSGYLLEDEAFYTVELVTEILPAVFDPDLAATPPTGERQEVRAPSDPAVSAVWPVHLADVSRALDRSPLDSHERMILHGFYGPTRVPVDRLAEVLELSVEDVERKHQRALRAMVDTLGGGRPKGCDYSCAECHGNLLTSM